MAVDQTTLMLLHEAQVTSPLLITSSATPTVNTDYTSYVDITAQAVAITSMTTNLTGPNTFDGQSLTYRILSAGANAIAWGAKFESVGATLPVITVAGKRITVSLRYDITTAKWGCTGVVTEA